MPVTEEIVYGTGVMESFPSDFKEALDGMPESSEGDPRWVVVFSPTGCDRMLRGLGWLDEAGLFDVRLRDSSKYASTRVATIGPTTRSHLVDTFGFEPDVSAKVPSPEGVVDAIKEFEKTLHSK